MTDSTLPIPPTPPHPAKFTESILDEIGRTMLAYDIRGDVFDPFAGVGRVHQLTENGYVVQGVPYIRTFGLELEPEWAAADERTTCGSVFDAAHIFGLRKFDALVSSPCYGNRMADHHNARDGSKRNTYRHKLGRELSAGSSAGLQWGPAYRDFHRRAWAVCASTLKPGAYVIINVKDHVRGGEVQKVSEFHRRCWAGIGDFLGTRQVKVSGNGFGANGKVRVPHEDIHVFRIPE